MKKIIFAALWFLSFSLTAAAYNTYAPNSWDTVKKEAPFTEKKTVNGAFVCALAEL